MVIIQIISSYKGVEENQLRWYLQKNQVDTVK